MLRLQPCLTPDCPEVQEAARCTRHTREVDGVRVRRRGTLYQGDYPRRRAACIREQPWCTFCGSTRRLTADHVRAGDPSSPLRTLCLSCNSRRGAGGGEGV